MPPIPQVRPIPDFPEYFVTDIGEVWSAQSRRWLKATRTNKGYPRVTLCRNGKEHLRHVHRLVLEAFVGLCPAGMECCHKNGMRDDNQLHNLCWGTKSDNSLDAVKHGTHSGFKTKGAANGQAKLTENDVKCIVDLWNTGLLTQREIARQYGVTPSQVNLIIKHKTWKHLWI